MGKAKANQKLFLAILEGRDAKSALPIIAINDKRLIRLVIDHITKKLVAAETRQPEGIIQ